MPELPQAAPPEGAGSPPAGTLAITSFEIGKTYDRDTGAIGQATQQFSAGDTGIHVTVTIAGLAPGATVSCRLVAVSVRTAEGKTVKDAEIAGTDTRAPDSSSRFHFDFHPTLGGWPTGDLQIELSVENKVVKTADITIR